MEPIHHIYVDFENVQSIQVPLITGKPVTLTLVLGSRQDTLPVDLIKSLLGHAAQVRLVDTKATGKNALDFVLACELGGMCAMQPKAEYHIISKDKGFDAVIDHLRAHGIAVARRERFDAVPVFGVRVKAPEKTPENPPESAPPKVKRVTPPTLEERVELILARLTQNSKSRPARKVTLLSSTHAYFGKELSEAEIEAVVKRLVSRRKITISDKGAVTYHLP